MEVVGRTEPRVVHEEPSGIASEPSYVTSEYSLAESSLSSFLPPIAVGHMLIDKLKRETAKASKYILRVEGVFDREKQLFYRRKKVHQDALDCSPIKRFKVRSSPRASPRSPSGSDIVAQYRQATEGASPPAPEFIPPTESVDTTTNESLSPKTIPVPGLDKWDSLLTDPSDFKDLQPEKRHERIESLHGLQLVRLVLSEKEREKTRQKNLAAAMSKEDKDRLEESYQIERALAKERIKNYQHDTRILVEHSRQQRAEERTLQEQITLITKAQSPMTKLEALERRPRPPKKMIKSPLKARKKLSAVKLFRRNERMHNEHLKLMVETEVQKEKLRMIKLNKLKASPVEMKKRAKVARLLRRKARDKIQYIDEDRQLILEKGKVLLEKQLQEERAKKIIANKVFRQRAKDELAIVVERARFITIVNTVVHNAYYDGRKRHLATCALRRYVAHGRAQCRARDALKRQVQNARSQIWRTAVEDLFNNGERTVREMDWIEYKLFAAPCREHWRDGYLICTATDTELRPMLGHTKQLVPMDDHILAFLKKSLPMENVFHDYHRCVVLLREVLGRLRFARVPESSDGRKERLEDPWARVKGLQFGLAARGIFRKKSAPNQVQPRNGRILRRVFVNTGLRTQRQKYQYKIKRRTLLPADLGPPVIKEAPKIRKAFVAIQRAGSSSEEETLSSGDSTDEDGPLPRPMSANTETATNFAATEMQKVTRGYLGRKNVAVQRQNEDNKMNKEVVTEFAATEVQRIVRGNRGRKRAHQASQEHVTKLEKEIQSEIGDALLTVSELMVDSA